MTTRHYVHNVYALGLAGDGITAPEAALIRTDLDRIGSREFDVRRYSGTTIDRINAAITDAASVGGGRVVGIVGTQEIDPSVAPITARSGVTLDLGDGILKVADSAGPYNTIIRHYTGEGGGRLQRFTVRGGLIDQNSMGQPGNNVTPGGATPGMAIRLYDFDSVHIDGVSITGGGTNFVLASDLTGEAMVTGCTFEFAQAASSTPDYDHSAIYMETYGQRVIGNRFATQISERARGAIEVHGVSGVISNNTVEYYQTLANVTSPDPGAVTATDDSIMVITGNTLQGGNYGVRLWPYAGKSLRKVNISHNVIDLSQLAWNLSTSCGIAPATDASLTGTLEDIDVAHNSVYFQSGDTRAGITARDVVGIATSGHAGPSNHVRVDDNLVVRAPTFAYSVGETVHGTTTYKPRLRGNRARNAGGNTAMTDVNRAAYTVRGIVVGADIDRNEVDDTGTPTQVGKYSVHAQPATGSSDNRVTGMKVTTSNAAPMLHSVKADIITNVKNHTVDLGSIAGGATTLITVAVPGTGPRDTAVANPTGGIEAGLNWTVVCGTNEVLIYINNLTASAIDPGSRTWRIRVFPVGIDV